MVEKMDKILIAISSLKFGGGAEKVAYILGKELNRNHKIKYFTFYNINPKYNVDVDYEYCLNEKLKFNTIDKLKKLISRAYYIAKFCKNNNLHFVISFMEESNFSVILSKYLGNESKIIVSVRQSPIAYKSHLYYTLIKLLYPKADKIITASKEMELILNRYFNIPEEKIKTIYNPHYVSKYQKLANESLEIEYEKIFKGSFIFINIGRLTEQKGQWFLIRGFKKVVEKHSNAKLIILGEGELRKELEDLIRKLNLENNVFLLGVHKNPFKFLKNSQCYAFPSLWEGLPNTLIEALTINLPIISTDCETGPREILTPELDIGKKIDYPYFGRYGILIKPFPREYIFKDLEERPPIEGERQLAELMIRMIEDDELRKRYSNGSERAKDFDVEKIVKEWGRVIND